ncbi:Rho termination factor N-terminal domain-containing protein, partial [Enteractinococcus fodinae]
GDESEEAADEARALEDLPADELYRVAQQMDIAGRATMDQEQLVEALQAEGVQEIVDGEPVGEEAFAGDESEEAADEARALEDLPADELYPVAQQMDIAGRATMDQEQLVEALQAEGVHEVADGEPVIEGAPAEEDAEEHADEARPLDELTANELYRVAQRLDIAGRSTMRKAQLVEALQAEGIDEAEV